MQINIVKATISKFCLKKNATMLDDFAQAPVNVNIKIIKSLANIYIKGYNDNTFFF
jgi:hypothetical protein